MAKLIVEPSEEQWEKAARNYCKLVGLDPDESVTGGAKMDPGQTMTFDVAVHYKRWETVLQKLKDYRLMKIALDSALILDVVYCDDEYDI